MHICVLLKLFLKPANAALPHAVTLCGAQCAPWVVLIMEVRIRLYMVKLITRTLCLNHNQTRFF